MIFQHSSRVAMVLAPCLGAMLLSSPATRYIRLVLALGVVVTWCVQAVGASRESVLASTWATCFGAGVAVWLTALPALRHSLWNLLVAHIFTQMLFLTGVFCALQFDWIWLESPRMARLMERVLIGTLSFPAGVLGTWQAVEYLGPEKGVAFGSILVVLAHTAVGAPLKRSEKDGAHICQKERILQLGFVHFFSACVLAAHFGSRRIGEPENALQLLLLVTWPFVPGTLLTDTGLIASDFGSAAALLCGLGVLASVKDDVPGDEVWLLLTVGALAMACLAYVVRAVDETKQRLFRLAISLALALGAAAEHRLHPRFTFVLLSSLLLLIAAVVKHVRFCADLFVARLLPWALQLAHAEGSEWISLVGFLLLAALPGNGTHDLIPGVLVLGVALATSVLSAQELASLGLCLACVAYALHRARGGRARRIETARVLVLLVSPLVTCLFLNSAAAVRCLFLGLGASALMAVDGVLPDLLTGLMAGALCGWIEPLAGVSALVAGMHTTRPSNVWAIALVALTCVSPSPTDAWLCALCATLAKQDEARKALAWTSFACSAWLVRSPFLALFTGLPLLCAWPSAPLAILAGASVAIARVLQTYRTWWVLALVPGWTAAARASFDAKGNSWAAVPLEIGVMLATPVQSVRWLAAASIAVVALANLWWTWSGRRPMGL